MSSTVKSQGSALSCLECGSPLCSQYPCFLCYSPISLPGHAIAGIVFMKHSLYLTMALKCQRDSFVLLFLRPW